MSAQGLLFETIALTGDTEPGGLGPMTTLQTPSLNNDGSVAFSAFLSDSTTAGNRIVNKFSEGTLERMLRGGSSGNAVPNSPGVTFSTFGNSPIMDDDGNIYFGANLSSGRGLFSVDPSGQLTWIAGYTPSDPTGKHVPADQVFGADQAVTFGVQTSADLLTPSAAGGYVAFRAALVPSSAFEDSEFGNNSVFFGNASSDPNELHANLTRAMQQGEPIPFPDGNTFGSNSLSSPAINSSGQIVFRPIYGGNNHRGVFTGSAEEGIVAVAVPGMAFEAVGEDITFNTTGAQEEPVINSSGNVAFRAGITGTGTSGSNNTVVGFWSDGELSLVARQNRTFDPNLGDVRTLSMAPPVLNDNDWIAFRSTLGGDDVTAGVDDIAMIFGPHDAIGIIARRGDQALGLDSDIIFADFSPRPMLNSMNQMLFMAHLAGPSIIEDVNDQALYFYDPAFNLIPIVRLGDSFEVAQDDWRTIVGIDLFLASGGADGAPRSLNDQMQASFLLEFDDGSSGIFLATIPEPGAALLGILGLLLLLSKRRRTDSAN